MIKGYNTFHRVEVAKSYKSNVTSHVVNILHYNHDGMLVSTIIVFAHAPEGLEQASAVVSWSMSYQRREYMLTIETRPRQPKTIERAYQ